MTDQSHLPSCWDTAYHAGIRGMGADLPSDWDQKTSAEQEQDLIRYFLAKSDSGPWRYFAVSDIRVHPSGNPDDPHCDCLRIGLRSIQKAWWGFPAGPAVVSFIHLTPSARIVFPVRKLLTEHSPKEAMTDKNFTRPKMHALHSSLNHFVNLDVSEKEVIEQVRLDALAKIRGARIRKAFADYIDTSTQRGRKVTEIVMAPSMWKDFQSLVGPDLDLETHMEIIRGKGWLGYLWGIPIRVSAGHSKHAITFVDDTCLCDRAIEDCGDCTPETVRPPIRRCSKCCQYLPEPDPKSDGTTFEDL